MINISPEKLYAVLNFQKIERIIWIKFDDVNAVTVLNSGLVRAKVDNEHGPGITRFRPMSNREKEIDMHCKQLEALSEKELDGVYEDTINKYLKRKEQLKRGKSASKSIKEKWINSKREYANSFSYKNLSKDFKYVTSLKKNENRNTALGMFLENNDINPAEEYEDTKCELWELLNQQKFADEKGANIFSPKSKSTISDFFKDHTELRFRPGRRSKK